MINLKRLSLFLCGILLSIVLSGTESIQAAASNPDIETRTPIHHFITLMQQNHTFDNYFGTYPGADGLPPNTCLPSSFPGDSPTSCIPPFHIGTYPVTDIGHNDTIFSLDYNNGQMNGFIRSLDSYNLDGKLSMGYYDGQDIGYYWNLAQDYVLFDHYFTSAHIGSVPNRMFWVAGTPGVMTNNIPKQGFGNLLTIFDLLQERGISWKFYVSNYDSSLNYRSLKNLNYLPPQVQWVPLLSFDRFIDDPNLSSHIVDLQQYYTDLQNGTLPAVSYVVLLGASEHPGTNIQLGEKASKSMIQALMQSSAWSSSAFLITYDDWGGWYDHVVPPQVDQYGYGFRVPAMLVSPYARQGYIDSTQLDHTSNLKFIEDNWGVRSLAQRDYEANDFLSAFDFSKPPRDPAFIPLIRTTSQASKEPSRMVIYVAYGSALIFAALMLIGAFISKTLKSVKPHFPRQEDSSS